MKSGRIAALCAILVCAGCASDQSTSSSTASGSAPTVTAGTGAGQEEGNLLTAVAINEAARNISNCITKGQLAAGGDTAAEKCRKLDAADLKTVVVFTGPGSLDVSLWDIFKAKIETLKYKLGQDAAKFPESHRKSPASGSFIAPGLSAVGEGIDAAIGTLSSVLSHLGTNIAVSGNASTTTDYMLAVAVCGNLAAQSDCMIASQINGSKGRGLVQEQLADLGRAVEAAVAAYARGRAKENGSKKHDAAIEASLQVIKTDLDDVFSLLNWLYGSTTTIAPPSSAPPSAPPASASASPASPAPAPATPAPATQSNYQALTIAAAVSKALDDGAAVLNLQIHSASSGVIAKSNLWNTLGAVPVYVSAGVTLSYAVYRNDAARSGGADLHLYSSGLFGALTPYHTLGNTLRSVTLDKKGRCAGDGADAVTPAATGLKNEAAKFCAQ